MDALLSGVAGDLIGRLVSFLIGKYQEPNENATAVRLQQALLRARVVVEEAEGRQIANRAMLQQLIQLRRQFCRAAYALDVFRWSSHTIVSRSRLRIRPRPSGDCSGTLSVMVESLESTLNDMREFLVLLSSCPRVTRQPYSTYLVMESCMFGRQLEKQEIISFLLKPSQVVDVLPIIGPHEIGKRSLVEPVCLDERVQQCFTKIHRLSSSDLDLHSHRSFLFYYTARSLMVIDIADGDADAEESCRSFHSVARRRAHGESKIIVISRTEAHSSLGTVPPLRLRALSREELWYFFKSLAFGPVDSDEHPELVRIARTMFSCCARLTPLSLFKSLFTSVSISATALRADVSARSWRRLLKVLYEGTHLQLGAAGDGWKEVIKNGPYYLGM